jgi:ligand-binding sensor domain-containing protein/two-component sensor histidine kinase
MAGNCRGESNTRGQRVSESQCMRWVGLALVLCATSFSWSATREPVGLNYARTLWHVSDGLPEDTVQAISESLTEQLWIGTTGGLVRFDGAHIHIYGNGPERHLPVNSIFCLTVDRDGVLWAGTEGGGLLRIDSGGWRAYSRADGLENGFVRSVLQDSEGKLWVGTDDGLFRQHGERFERQNLETPATPLAVHDIIEDRTHRIWIGGSHLYSVDPDGHATQYALPGTDSENRVRAMLQTIDGTVWVGTVGGLQQLSAGRFHNVPELRASVRSLMQSSDGTLWIGTIGSGLWAFRDGYFSRVDSPGLLPSDTVLKIFEDAAHQIWIGTRAGLVRLNRTIIHIVPLPKTGDTDVETVFRNNHPGLQLAAEHFYNVRGEKPYRIGLPEIGNAPVRVVFRASDGSFWIGTEGSGAFHLRDGKTAQVPLHGELMNKSIRAFLETRSGEIWIATDDGVSRIRASGIEKLTEAGGLAYFSARSLLEDREGNIWIGTDHGLSRWVGGHFVKDAVTTTLSEEKVWSILQDRNGILWFGTRDHGLFRYSHGNLEQLTTIQGLPTNSIYGILQDRNGVLWITGPNTIASLFESEMDAPRSADRSLLNARVYRMPFAAEGALLYGGSQPVGYPATDGSMWFPTNRGVAQVSVPRQSALPVSRIQIDAIEEDGVETSITSNLRVPASVNRLSFSFFASSLQRQDRLRFRWKLDGFDNNWNTAGSSRIATYTNLPPGHYRFRVAASDPARPGLLEQEDIAFVKEPYFYETWWFYLMCSLVLVGVACVLCGARMRQVRKRFSAVLEERERLAREMHDTVIQGCTGISALLEALVGAGVGESSEGPQSELLNHARDQAHRTIDEARQAVWNLRHGSGKEIDLIEALRGLAAQTMRDGGSSVRIQHNVPHLEMNAIPANEILMAVREAVCNAVRHSGSETIVVDLRSSKEELTLSIRDYGCGMRKDEVAPDKMHYGIVGMDERMRRLGGGLHIDGAPGAGTTVQLQLRWGKIRKAHAGI